MSDQQIVAFKRRINRLFIDSEEEERKQQEERQRLQEIRLRKQEKRRKRKEQAKRAEEAEKRRIELEKHYKKPQTMLQPDSDSDDRFQRAEDKIKKAYPQFHHKRRTTFSSQDQDSQQQSNQQEQSSSKNKKKAGKTHKRQGKQIRKSESEEGKAPKQRSQKIKMEEKDPKDNLVNEVAVRWWYCLPEWPPAGYNYEKELKKLGYRLVESNRFRMQENLVNGLLKASPVDGFTGIFKTKQKIIDIRPKESCPSLQLLRSYSMTKLNNLLKAGLKKQINQLNNQQYQRNGDLELIEELTKKLNLLDE